MPSARCLKRPARKGVKVHKNKRSTRTKDMAAAVKIVHATKMLWRCLRLVSYGIEASHQVALLHQRQRVEPENHPPCSDPIQCLNLAQKITKTGQHCLRETYDFVLSAFPLQFDPADFHDFSDDEGL